MSYFFYLVLCQKVLELPIVGQDVKNWQNINAEIDISFVILSKSATQYW